LWPVVGETTEQPASPLLHPPEATPILRAGPCARISAQFRSLDRTLDDQDAEANISQAEKTVINVAKWALLTLLALPILELAVFIAVAAIFGFGWALSLMLAGSLTGLLKRHLGSAHITRMRVVLEQGSFTALQADNRGGQVIFAGILLLVPGFITDIVALILLIAPLRRALSAFGAAVAPAHNGGVVDLAPEQWHQVSLVARLAQRRTRSLSRTRS
jgi:UPF0716 protein FxsA